MTFIQQAKLEHWQKQQKIFSEIYKNGMLNYVKNNPDSKYAFSCNDGCLCCIDEGIAGQEHLAGAGILWKNRDELKQYLRKAKIKKIFSHQHCGAAKLYTKINHLDETKSDEYGREFAKNLAEELGIKWEHIEEKKMQRPGEFHIARIIYYDATNHFNYTLAKIFPPGFEVSRGLSDKKHALEELSFSLEIIFDSKHGFGELISEENPVVICPIADTNNKELDRAMLTEEVANLISNLGLEFKNKILVSGFTAPKLNFLDKIAQPSYFRSK